MATGATRYGSELLAVPGIRKDGSQISLEFSVCLLRGESGSIEGIAAVLRDVTERWQQQRELQQRLAALEAQVAM
jgi:PAS domain S-box-containing protein